MATIKSYTDLEQSKKLAKILPLESADMAYYFWKKSGNIVNPHPFILDGNEVKVNGVFTYLNCWSLAALIDIIENIDKLQKVEISFTHNGDKYWVDVHFDEFGSFCQDYELYDSKVDALIATIEKFKNRNLL